MKGMIFMKCLFLGLAPEAMKEREPLGNDGVEHAETIGKAIVSYVLCSHEAPPDRLIVFTSPDNICDFDNVNLLTKFFTSRSARKETSLQTDFLSFRKSIEQICADKGISPPTVDMVIISDDLKDSKDRWEVLGKVHRILDDCDVSKEDICIMAADASSYAPITDAVDMAAQLIEMEGYTVEKLRIDTQNKISITETSPQLELFKAICEFADSGETKRLKRLKGKISDQIMTDLIVQLDVFAENLNMCQAEDLEPTLIRIYDIIDTLECTISTAGSFNRALCSKLRSVFGNSRPQISAMAYIECCLRWRWVTQSLIIFIDALPRELISKKIVQCDMSSVTCVTQAPEMELFYSHFTNMPIPKEEDIKELLESFLHGQLDGDIRSLFIEDFIEVIKGFENGMNDNHLTIPYNGIDILTSCSTDDNEGVREIREFIENNNFSTMSQFRRRLAANLDEVPYFFKGPLIYDNDPISKKIMGVRFFSLKHLRQSIKGFRLNIDYSNISSFRRFIGCYLYLKIVRNTVCHAGPISYLDDELNEVQKNEMSRFGIDTGAVTADSLSRNISAALNCLKKCLIPKKKRTIKKYYAAVPRSVAADDIHIRLRSLFGNVSCFDTITVYVISDEITSDEAEKAFISEMQEYGICNDFFINIERKKCSDPSALLDKLTSTAASGDKISVDFTDMTGLQILGLTLFLKTAAEKKAEIENVIYNDQCITDLINTQFEVQ